MTFWFSISLASFIDIASDLGSTCQVSRPLSADAMRYKLLKTVKDPCSFRLFFKSISTAQVSKSRKRRRRIKTMMTSKPTSLRSDALPDTSCWEIIRDSDYWQPRSAIRKEVFGLHHSLDNKDLLWHCRMRQDRQRCSERDCYSARPSVCKF